ncbi:hypothetical protein A2U01_0100165, partial [Trifolium medium]|nr:hypothetical protein [Trifolium medium]
TAGYTVNGGRRSMGSHAGHEGSHS